MKETDPKNMNIDVRHRTMLTLWFAQMMSVAMFFLLTQFVANSSDEPGRAANNLLSFMLAGVGTFSAVISFVLSDDYGINLFLKGLKIVTLGESLGGVESLMTHPATMTHGAIPYELRQKVGIVDNLVRLSVGIENKEDLLSDILIAIEAARR